MPRSKQGNDVAVQGTNESSIVSKCSTASQGYFKDDFLRLFVSKTSRRAPLINRGYYIRARVIDDVLKRFLSVHLGKKQIISLGAGFDSAFFRLNASNHLVNTTFYEVDFPDVVRRKATIIKATTQLRQQLGENIHNGDGEGIYLSSHGYHLLGMDLTNLSGLQRCLQQTAIDCRLPTLLLSECVLTYMEVRNSDALIQWASASFPNAVFLTYEQIHPNDAFGLVMRKHFEKLNSSLKAIQTYPTVEDQQQRFLSLGWQGTSAIDMNTYYNRLQSKERLRVESLEPFDEFEEWHLKCGHYAVIAGCSGTCSNIAEFLSEGHQQTASQCVPEHSVSIQTSPLSGSQQRPLRRFGHASSLLSAHAAVVVGGFGETEGKHARLGDVVIIDLKTGSWGTVPAGSGTQELGPRMHHSLTAIPGGNRWLLFGGRSSPIRPCNSTLILTLDPKQRVAVVPKPENQTLTSSGNVNPVLFTATADVLPIGNDSGIPTSGNGSDGNGLSLVASDACCQKTTNGDPASNPEKSRNLKKKSLPGDNGARETAGYSYNLIEMPNSVGPLPRWRHSAIRANVGGEEWVVIYGGRGTGETVFDDCWAFDVGKLEWQRLEITGDQPPASHSHSACVWQDTRMVIAGGLGTGGRPLTSVYVLDLETLRCKEMMLTPSLPPRYSHSAHVVDSRLLLVGGVNPLSGRGYTIAVVDLNDLKWHLCSFPACVCSRPFMIHSHTCEWLTDTSLVILGGGGNCFSFGTHLNDTPVAIRVPF